MEDWFLKIFNLYIDDIYRLAYSYTHSKEDSDDITQKTFIKYYKNINKINKNEKDAKKWLVTVTINECKDLFKTAWRKKTIFINEDNENFLYKNKNDNNENLYFSLKKLPKKYRLVIHLYYFMGYNTKEISKIMKINESTVRQRLLRGRNKLKNEMRCNYE